MTTEVLRFDELDRTQVAIAGGKGANLGELARMDGIRVPPGFCVTAGAFERVLSSEPSIDDELVRLAAVDPDDRASIATFSARIRRTIEAIALPDDLAASISDALAGADEHQGYAVRSSATAEDLPTASFAGQQDTYLNVVGADAVLRAVSRCWASLFTDRAVTYRLRNGFDHRAVHMAVVVQQLVVPDASGIMFTADPVTGNRRVVAVEASFGLGEALVSGLVNPDTYEVREGEIVAATIARKRLAINALPGGGTEELVIDPSRQDQPALTDAQVLHLAELGRWIEAHFGCPQDIEWCLVDDGFLVVQSRPITTLFPIPDAGDNANHVYLSVGHQQMMTDPMKPLGLSLWQLTTPRPMAEAGGRLFADVTPILGSPATCAGFIAMMRASDPLMGDAVTTVVERGDFVPPLPDGGPVAPPHQGGPPDLIDADPALVTDLIASTEASIIQAEHLMATTSGAARFDAILEDIGELRRVLFDPASLRAIMTGMGAATWLNDQMATWLGETNAADALTRSVPNNVTSEMGLALLDVADVIRPHPEVVAFLRGADDDVLDQLMALDGGPAAREAISAYLDRYGMRCVGEIDITRPRWGERPSTLVPLILGNIERFEPGERARRFEQGLQEAQAAEADLLARLRALPDGEQKAAETKRMIDRVRTFAGYREHPKYGMVSRYLLYKQALLAEAERLVDAGVLGEVEDAFFLRFEELHDVVRTGRVDGELVGERRAAFRTYAALTPPRVLTSDGEAVAGTYGRDDLPAGALVGLAVSAGTIEGRARVILDLADADVEAGDILVTTATDPSWSPLFVAIAGLVTEVGGLMTHGAVVAREYGLPAVVGVEGATRLIRDGRRIRVHGTDGYVELLP